MSVCPYPGRCEFDDFPHCGMHFCGLARCLYPAACRRALTDEINRIILAGRAEVLADKLEQLRAERDAIDWGSP